MQVNTFLDRLALGMSALSETGQITHDIAPRYNQIADRFWFYAIDDFGAVADGISDTTPAFNAALAAADGNSARIVFGAGEYVFLTKPNRIPTGIVIEGNGSAGTTAGYGTRLTCAYAIATATEAFLEWDGSGTAYAGAGGGYRNLQVYRASAYSGGTAIKLSGADDNHRAGFFFGENFVIATTGTSTWNRGVMVDGTGLVTLGTKGIREVRLSAGVIASCSDTDANVYLYNAVHVYGFALHLIPSVSAACGMTVTGPSGSPSTNVFLASCNIDGNLTIDYVDNLHWHGRIGGNLTTTANSNTVSIHGAVTGTVTAYPSLSFQMHLDTSTWARKLVPTMNATDSAQYAGISMLPKTTGQGADFIRARSVDTASGLPLGLSVTPATGGAGSPYMGYNTNQKTGDNDQTYYRTGYPAFRFGNPLGNGTYPVYDCVAPAGTAGDTISWVISRQVHGTTGVQEFPVGILVGGSVSLVDDILLFSRAYAYGSSNRFGVSVDNPGGYDELYLQNIADPTLGSDQDARVTTTAQGYVSGGSPHSATKAEVFLRSSPSTSLAEVRAGGKTLGLDANGLKLTVPDEYADNAAAKAAGLADGTFYRTGDVLKVVHA